NPFTDLLRVTVRSEDPGPVTIAIYHVSGDLVDNRSEIIPAPEHTWNLTTSSWPDGVYVLEVKVDQHTVLSEKVIRVH
ncbi:MAG: T9SS type A sorting domain-containing protein, partial [Saprospiraceae bacterium]|nr:T9SS type A sorting domain-containing protein [Saprospiraceae bacterium]